MRNWLITPTEESLREYLKNPIPKEDIRMTQIDVLKSSAIEIFYNLLTLNSNANNNSMFQFMRSDEQRKHNYIFLRNLTQHLIYSYQPGIKLSICEFLKDLISQDTQELKQMFSCAILDEVTARMILFLSDQEPEDFAA